MKMTVVGFWGGFPEAGEATSGYLFEHDGFRLLVDCGSGVLAQLQKYITPSDIDAVVLSHYHHDRCCRYWGIAICEINYEVRQKGNYRSYQYTVIRLMRVDSIL